MSLDYTCKLEKKKVRKSQKKKKKGVLFCPVLPVFSCESINTRSHSRQRWNAPPRPPPKAMYPRQQSQSINLNIPGDCGAGGTGGRRGRALSCGRRRTTRPPNRRPRTPDVTRLRSRSGLWFSFLWNISGISSCFITLSWFLFFLCPRYFHISVFLDKKKCFLFHYFTLLNSLFSEIVCNFIFSTSLTI